MEELTTQIKDKRLFLLDIDGTISFDAIPIDGTRDFCHRVVELGGKYIFITNNSTKGIEDYVKKFARMKIPADETNFLTAGFVSAIYLKERYGKKLLHVVGTKSYQNELRRFGLRVTEGMEEEIQAVVVGFDDELTYEKVVRACELLETRKIDYLATNPDLACPVGFGYIPDCGAICGMIGQAVGREPEYIGKPNRIIVDLAMQRTGRLPEETVVIGDRLYTDIACGIQAGVDTVAVFTGEAKREDLKDTPYPPTYYCESIRNIYEAIR